MQKFYTTIRNFKLLKNKDVGLALSYFSKKELVFLYVFAAVLLASTLSILQGINSYFMVEVPHRGGTVSEGMVGTPRFVNPLLAYSDVDRDLTGIIYSGLMKKNT